MEEPGGLQSIGSWRVGRDWATSLSLFTFMHWRRKWQPTPVFLPGESQGWGSLVGCHLWGCTESDTTGETWQQQQHWNKFLYRHNIWAVWSHTFSWWEWRHTKVAFELELLEGCFVWILVPLNKLIPAHSLLPATLPLASHLAGFPRLCWLGSFDCFIWDEIRTVPLTSACLIQTGPIR